MKTLNKEQHIPTIQKPRRSFIYILFLSLVLLAACDPLDTDNPPDSSCTTNIKSPFNASDFSGSTKFSPSTETAGENAQRTALKSIWDELMSDYKGDGVFTSDVKMYSTQPVVDISNKNILYLSTQMPSRSIC